MATAAKAEDLPAGAADGAPPKKKKKLLMLIVGAVVLLAAGGGGAWFFLGKKGDAAQAEPPKPVKKTTEFTSIEPWFTVNLAPGDGDERYLQAGLVLEISDKKADAQLKAKMPLVRSQILLLLSGKTAKELLTPDGKTKLAAEVLTLVRAQLDVAPPDNGIEGVHFSIFVIQ